VSKGGRGLNDDEKKLWRRVAARVKARCPPPTEADTDEPPPAKAISTRGAVRTSASAPTPKQRAPAPAPQNRGAEKRVRRGQLEIGGTLDLHGHNQDTGRAALVRFLRAAQARGARTVIVITGVGRAGQGVLKTRLPEWLAQKDLSPLVSGFAKAHRTHGGDGAYYVFLRRGGTT
jgi:DNA-nicking Smr family endonuclease